MTAAIRRTKSNSDTTEQLAHQTRVFHTTRSEIAWDSDGISTFLAQHSTNGAITRRTEAITRRTEAITRRTEATMREQRKGTTGALSVRRTQERDKTR